MTTRRSAELLIARFEQCLGAYDRDCPFTKFGQLEYHLETIQRRRELGSARAAIQDRSFQQSLYRTLQAWGIGARASILKPFPDFVDGLSARAADIQDLDGLVIDARNLNAAHVGATLARLVQTLDIVENKARVVPGSKALHHILPDLVVPIDREYTQRFFEWPNPRFQNYPESCVVEAFAAFVTIAQATNPIQYMGSGWYSSRTKVIDNAVVGLWCLIKAQIKKVNHDQTSGSGTPPRTCGASGGAEG